MWVKPRKQTAPEYDLPAIEEAIVKLAEENKRSDAGGEVIVSRRIIQFLEKRCESQKTLSELCAIYLATYMK